MEKRSNTEHVYCFCIRKMEPLLAQTQTDIPFTLNADCANNYRFSCAPLLRCYRISTVMKRARRHQTQTTSDRLSVDWMVGSHVMKMKTTLNIMCFTFVTLESVLHVACVCVFILRTLPSVRVSNGIPKKINKAKQQTYICIVLFLVCMAITFVFK